MDSVLKMYKNKRLWIYLLKFIGIFSLCYFGTLLVIGLAAPGNYYSPFVERYLDYVSWIKVSLLKATGFFLSIFSIPTHTEPGFLIRMNKGRGVIIAMDCVGYGVYSFWIAFIVANKGRFLKKIAWILLGVFALWLINVIRISLFLVAINKGWPMPLGVDHHTWFSIAAYILIFVMIWLYDRSFRENKLNNSAFER
ncbi:MAG: exosortase/archaeosortase family protein [Bacteroidota bacterium]|nr:exosortase/archaeosortase family protein [Bacteroidota bacterium]